MPDLQQPGRDVLRIRLQRGRQRRVGLPRIADGAMGDRQRGCETRDGIRLLQGRTIELVDQRLKLLEHQHHPRQGRDGFVSAVARRQGFAQGSLGPRGIAAGEQPHP